MMNVAVLNLALGMVGLGLSFFLVRVMLSTPGWGPVVGVTGLLVTLITLMQPRAGLYLLVYSMLLSPGFAAGQIAQRAVEVRLDDVFLLLVFVAWFVIATLKREALLGLQVPLVKPMMAYIAVAAVSSLMGVVRGTIGFNSTFFFVLKYAEYYMLYYMTFSMVKTFKDSRPYLLSGLLTALIVLFTGYKLILAGARPHCPFDIHEGIGESATFAGYLVVVMGMASGVGLYHKDPRVRLAMAVLLVACIPPLLSAGSRSSYLAAAGVFTAMFLLGKGHRFLLILAGAMAFYLLPFIFGPYIRKAQERVAYTTEAQPTGVALDVGGRTINLETSAATRLRMWNAMWKFWLRDRPLLGYGVTGVGLVDTQIPRVIGETGLLGFFFWGSILWQLFRKAWQVSEKAREGLEKGIAFGFICVYIGLLVQSIGVNSFIIIRIMEPFWFLAAIIMRLWVEQNETPAAAPAARPAWRRSYT